MQSHGVINMLQCFPNSGFCSSMTTLWQTMLLTHWPPQPQQNPLSTMKRKSSSSQWMDSKVELIESRLSPGYEVSFGRSLARVGRLGAENNGYLSHYHVVSNYYTIYHAILSHYIIILHNHIILYYHIILSYQVQADTNQVIAPLMQHFCHIAN